jgi:hypothetical protein
MSDIRYIDRLKYEKLFEMESGYVLNFSNRTFRDFVLQTTGKDIYDSKYDGLGSSKANRLRKFWETEANFIVGKLNSNLLEYWKALQTEKVDEAKQSLYEDCFKITEALKQDSMDEHLNAIQPNTDEKDFKVLAKSIRENIERNEPESAIDRLHTFVIKYIRRLCDKHQIKYDKEKALHSFYGEYVKHLKSEGKIESEMTERILKSSISVLEAYNQVRNNQSFAHDNPILNYNESLLIFKNISSIIEFLDSIETDNIKEVQTEFEINFGEDGLPF